MPEAFDKCKKAGGRIRTVSGPNKQFGLAEGEYVHVCFKDGQSHPGYKKKKHKELKE